MHPLVECIFIDLTLTTKTCKKHNIKEKDIKGKYEIKD